MNFHVDFGLSRKLTLRSLVRSGGSFSHETGDRNVEIENHELG